jgi:hypothetical protein
MCMCVCVCVCVVKLLVLPVVIKHNELNGQCGCSLNTFPKIMRQGFVLPVMSLQLANIGRYSVHEYASQHDGADTLAIAVCKNGAEGTRQIFLWHCKFYSRTSNPRTDLRQVCGSCVIFPGTSSSLPSARQVAHVSTNRLHHLAIKPRNCGFCSYLL